MSVRPFSAVALCAALFTSLAIARPPATLPTREEVADLLRREPITGRSWPEWRKRLLEWIGDRSHATDAAYEAARQFVRKKSEPGGRLTDSLERDAFAWYMLGRSLEADIRPGYGLAEAAAKAEKALRRSIALNPSFARAHRNLGVVLLVQPAKAAEGEREIAEAGRLDPKLPLCGVKGQAALLSGNYAAAETEYRKALVEEPNEVDVARALAASIVQNRNRGQYADGVRPLVDQFPDDGVLACLSAMAYTFDNNARAAHGEIERARALGTDPEHVLSKQAVAAITSAGAPAWYESTGRRLGVWLLGFAGVYAVAMLLMAGAGVMLASRTRGARALELLGPDANELVTAGGQVRRVGGETTLAKIYVAALAAGLILFYAAVPFVIAGLIGATGFLLWLIFQANRIPVKLVVLIVIIGGGAAWAVLKSLFAKPAAGGFGLKKTAADCPRLHAAVAEVAGRVDTDPVDEIYIAPGSSIGVHQEGRGPFGMFGVKKRVLTLGLSTMHYLTVDELKAILAHEYAHFSHADTFIHRFVYQVSLSIGSALEGMGASAGKLNYVNPFFWFFVLYHKAYDLLSAGYSRSREFLADRMAAALYGSKVFESALTKVSTDGSLFEMTIYQNITGLLAEQKAFVNMYSSFREFRDTQLNADERAKMYEKLLAEEGSLFASHPTFKERIAALESLPPGPSADSTPARDLFEDPETIETELTDFLTGYVAHVQALQQQAAQQAG